MAVDAMIFNMVAELPGSDPLGAMKLPEEYRENGDRNGCPVIVQNRACYEMSCRV